MLGIEPWDRQVEILDAVARHPRVAVRSGHKIGKSTSAAIIALWWWSTRPRAWVVMTSATARQVRDILWKELSRLHRGARVAVGGRVPLDPGTGIKLPDGRGIVGFSTDKPENMAGISGATLLFILDEASGIEEQIFEAVEGNRAGGAHLVMFSNPTKTSGTFFDAFNTKREFWHTIHVSSVESPNAKAGKVVIPGLATAEWIAEKRREWGPESPLFQVRVEGNFPAQSSDAVVPLSLVEAGVARWAEIPEEGELHFGVDVARFGDDESIICPRRGLKAFKMRHFQGLDGVQLAGEVLRAAREMALPGETPLVKIDVIGAGASVADQLRSRKEVRTVEVNVANSADASDANLYHRLRDQLWFSITDWLKEGGAIPDDSKLLGELVAPTYGFDPQGRMQVEPKDRTKQRIQRSPDRADALALAIYGGRRRATLSDLATVSLPKRRL